MSEFFRKAGNGWRSVTPEAASSSLVGSATKVQGS